jgi:hypothetical protein
MSEVTAPMTFRRPAAPYFARSAALLVTISLSVIPSPLRNVACRQHHSAHDGRRKVRFDVQRIARGRRHTWLIR